MGTWKKLLERMLAVPETEVLVLNPGEAIDCHNRYLGFNQGGVR